MSSTFRHQTREPRDHEINCWPRPTYSLCTCMCMGVWVRMYVYLRVYGCVYVVTLSTRVWEISWFKLDEIFNLSLCLPLSVGGCGVSLTLIYISVFLSFSFSFSLLFTIFLCRLSIISVLPKSLNSSLSLSHTHLLFLLSLSLTLYYYSLVLTHFLNISVSQDQLFFNISLRYRIVCFDRLRQLPKYS